MHWGNYGYGMAQGMGYGGGIMFLLVIALVALAVFLIVRSFGAAGRSHHEHAACVETPLDIAKKRYARGEITKNEFDHLRSALSRS